MTLRQFEVQSLTKDYAGRTVLADVSFTVSAGEHTAIIGPSGSGKSTLLRLLCGLETPSEGMILFDGGVASQPHSIIVPAHRRGLALVFQDLALWPNLSVLSNVELGLAGQNLSKIEVIARARETLALVGIPELATRKPGQISGGQQQRVALARAIAVRPTFLLLDEPFAGIDLAEKARLIGEIATLAASHQITIILVSHDPVEAAGLCPRAIVLDCGKIHEVGLLSNIMAHSTAEIFQAYRELYCGPLSNRSPT